MTYNTCHHLQAGDVSVVKINGIAVIHAPVTEEVARLPVYTHYFVVIEVLTCRVLNNKPYYLVQSRTIVCQVKFG